MCLSTSTGAGWPPAPAIRASRCVRGARLLGDGGDGGREGRRRRGREQIRPRRTRPAATDAAAPEAARALPAGGLWGHGRPRSRCSPSVAPARQDSRPRGSDRTRAPSFLRGTWWAATVVAHRGNVFSLWPCVCLSSVGLLACVGWDASLIGYP